MINGAQAPDKTWSASELSADSDLTLLQKIFLCTDGTLTDLLMLYCGQPIHARKLGQHLTGEGANGRILHRQVVLEKADQPYVYARSEFMFDRFSNQLQHQLIETQTPIGLLWQSERLEMYREIIERKSGQDESIATILQVPIHTAILSRTYRIHHGGVQIGEITENFAATIIR